MANTKVSVVILGRIRSSYYVLLIHLSLPIVLMLVRAENWERERMDEVSQAESLRSISFLQVPKFQVKSLSPLAPSARPSFPYIDNSSLSRLGISNPLAIGTLNPFVPLAVCTPTARERGGNDRQ